MDANYVHKRDVCNILTQFQNNIKHQERQLELPNSNKEQIEQDIQNLITTVDRDLRLKTQALVRSRLAQSRLLPIRNLNRLPPLQETDTVVPAEVRISTPASSLLLRKVLAKPKLQKASASISKTKLDTVRTNVPLDSDRELVSKSVPKTPMMVTRRKHIPTNAKHELPLYNRHDPLDPPKPLPENAVATYGLDALLESRLIDEGEAPKELNGLLYVSKFIGDADFSEAKFKQHWKLDERKEETTENKQVLTEAKKEVKEKPPEKNPEDGKWVFPLMFGIPMEDSKEFQAFKREFSNCWEEVEIVLAILAKICEKKCLKYEKVDGEIIGDLSKLEPDEMPKEKILRCFVRKAARYARDNPKVGFGFIGANAEDKAATVIQSVWRGFHARRLVRNIRRNAAAARIIQRWFRNTQNLRKTREYIKGEKNRREATVEKNQTGNTWRPDTQYIVLHLIEGHTGSELGRLASLQDSNIYMIIFTKKMLSVEQMEYAKKVFPDRERVQFVYAQQNLPKSLPIEDVLACDSRSLRKIKKSANGLMILVQPNRVRESLIEIASKLNALILAPAIKKMSMFQTYDSLARLMGSAKIPLFECSDELYDKVGLCKQLTELTVSHLSIIQWRIISGNDFIGWVNTNDFVLLERLKTKADCLTEDDLDDPNFHKLLTESITKDFPIIAETTSNGSVADFLKDLWFHGATIVAGPSQVVCSPSCAFEIPLTGPPRIVGTWENLYLSAYEPFASIHPAFLVSKEKLKKSVTRLATECSGKRLIGVSVVDYWYSTRTISDSLNNDQNKLKLTGDKLHIADSRRALCQMIANHVVGHSFDEESMSMGPSKYIYVQEQFICPSEVDMKSVKNQLKDFSFPVDEKLFMFADLADPNVFTLIVTEESPERLIALVHRFVFTMCESVFRLSLRGDEVMFTYCHAIDFLKAQLDLNGHLESTSMMQKVRKKDIKNMSNSKFFKLSMVNCLSNSSQSVLTPKQSSPTKVDSSPSLLTTDPPPTGE